MTQLRPYQAAAIETVGKAVESGRRRILLVCPTGGGKTVIAAAIVRAATDRGERVMFLAHRRELITQASAKLHDHGLDHGIVQAGFPPRPAERIQIASIQTLWSRAMRTMAMELPTADLIVVDECHHCPARTYRRILAEYPDAVVLGLTATPCRGDGRGLGNVFETIVQCPQVRELIDLGHLVPTRVYAPTTPDLTGVSVKRGDYVEAQLAQRMDQQGLVGDVVEHWHKLAEGRATVVFATGVQHSVHIRDEFRRTGVLCEHIDGSTPAEERDRALSQLAEGTVDVVTNCQVLTEGWDAPSVSCIVLARPTRHTGLYRQMIGRVLRPAPGKSDAIVLDHAGATYQHALVEEPVRWTLDTKKRAESPVHASRGAGKIAGLTNCPECSAVRLQGKACPVCKWRPQPKPRSVDVVDGELGRVDERGLARQRAYDVAAKRLFYCNLLWIARERGYKPGWAYHKYQEKFKDKPLWEWKHDTPVAPDDSVRSWVRSRAIAYAKAMEKRRGAA